MNLFGSSKILNKLIYKIRTNKVDLVSNAIIIITGTLSLMVKVEIS